MMLSYQEDGNLISLVLNSWLSHFIQELVELAGSLAFPGACFVLKTFTWLKGASYIVLYSLQILGTNMRAGGILKLAALVSVFFLAVFLAFQLLEINMDFNLGNVFGSMPVEEGPTRLERYKCGLSKPCPEGHFSFKMASGAASVVGPKICLEDNILMSGVKNNVGRGINIALVNGKTGDLIKTDHFDMWAGDVNTLITFLKTIEEGTVVMMATFDDSASKLNDESRKMIGELGSSSISTLGFRDNWIFVGGKGIKTKSPFEQHIKNHAETNKYEGWPEVLEMEGCIPQRQE